jgi:nicotinamide-nucleotide adenylyltransferase
MKERNALLVGRFQPFHKGHLHAVETLSKEFDKVIIGIGSAQYSHTMENPFTSGEREMMISKSLDKAGIKNMSIVPIEDLHRHSRWVAHVVSLVPEFAVVFTNDALTNRLFSEAGYDVRRIPYLNRKEYSGTEVRKRIFEGNKWEHLVPDEVAGIIREIDGVGRIQNIKAG